MIIYHKALDPYHCYYRFLFYSHSLKVNSVDFDRLRLMDFYYLFPSLLHDFDKKNSKKKKKKFPEQFENLELKIQIFFNLLPIQKQALGYLFSDGYYNLNNYLNSNEIVLEKEIEPEILDLFLKEKIGKETWIELFFKYFKNYELKKIKKLSKLMDTKNVI
ncbi:hypothetical protein QEJ31_07755 [Pigmentibacter sp. JX0631]|uniref:ABC-three component system middle component 5 n=1 Tax=Pigmentibacter sp. JX0631 TaxID=2976982 RepID=UPI0024685095|nr:ABC-three component system middle component 5 [Pigmentibacter sp. JX0631]WGL61483.1 hypothetical protein QEJ31_07755 [Pigmentibacter sp. JX0631]